MSTHPTVGIIGFGRFGRLWANFLKSDFDVAVFDTNAAAADIAKEMNVSFVSIAEIFKRDIVFYAVPISQFEPIVTQHAQEFSQFKKQKLVADLLSVKVHPKRVFEKVAPAAPVLLLHPMFGPDSVRLRGFSGLTVMIDPFNAPEESLNLWTAYLARRELVIQKMSTEEHDSLAARSQGITHFIGRMLGEMQFGPTSIDTLGARKLHEIKEQICNDSWQLFSDIQTYNPYTLEMRVSLGKAHAKLFNELLPNRVNTTTLIVGIQGGPGSFNEQAARYYLGRAGIAAYELRYLYRSERVLKALSEGEVDRGQFAIHNSLGGVVDESVEAMARYNFHIVEEYAIKIAHTLMMRPDAEFAEVDTVMSHPQALKQCSKNLAKKYSKLKQTSGEGEIIDHAKVAELLSKKLMPKNVATLGSKTLAEMYGLAAIEENLQDLDENYTSFMWVERPHPV